MSTLLYSSDIKVMLQLFAPVNYQLFVFDPMDRLRVEDEAHLESCTAEQAPKVLVNLGQGTCCYKQHKLSDFDLIVDYGNCSGVSMPRTRFDYRNNPDGTTRWLYPQKDFSAAFLGFYNEGTLKARAAAMLIRVLFALGMGWLFRSGTIALYASRPLKPYQTLAGHDFDQAAFFTGTRGPNRTAVMQLSKGGRATHYAKIALTRLALNNLYWEKRSTDRLVFDLPAGVEAPVATETLDAGMVVFSNIKPAHGVRTNVFTPLLAQTVARFFERTKQMHRLEDMGFRNLALNASGYLQKNGRKATRFQQLGQQVLALYETIDAAAPIYTTLAHGDFTPWNLYTTNDKVYLYDWELSHRQMPALYDLFHFCFQAQVVGKGNNFDAAREAIEKALRAPEIAALISRYGIDTETCYKLYLVQTVGYYSRLFAKSEKLSVADERLMTAWSDALSVALKPAPTSNCRRSFLQEFSARMRNTAHAALKMKAPHVTAIPTTSDLDLLVLKGDLPAIYQFASSHATVERCKRYRKSFMTTLELFFTDGDFLRLDLITDFHRKDLAYLSSKRLLNNSQPAGKGIHETDSVLEFEYAFLFSLLNGAGLSATYAQQLKATPLFHQKRCLSYLKDVYGVRANSIDALVDYNHQRKQTVMTVLKARKENRFLSRIGRALDWALDTLRTAFAHPGFVITLTGADGAGKTTVLRQMENRLRSTYRKNVVVLRHRPGLLPMLSGWKMGREAAEQRAATTLPHTGTNKNTLSSLLRFGYYFADYLLGQVWVYMRYTSRGTIVLYDRYYFDFINDGRRSNIELPKWFTRPLYALIHKPRLNFFLFAAPEVIAQRKQELNLQQIKQLNTGYGQLFDRFQKQFRASEYVQVENTDLERTISTIFNAYSHAA